MGFGRLRRRRVLPAAAASALVLGAAALASGATVPVSLKVVGSVDREIGQSVRLTATAKLPRGDRLLILGTRTARPRVKVAECLRSPCRGTFRDRSVEVVDFQASVIKRTGSRITTLGRSKKISVSWSEPAPPPPPPPVPPPPPPGPAAVPGHYQGRSSQNEIFNFDVTANGRGLANLQTGQINQSCDPPAYLSGGYLTAPGPFPVALDGSFTLSGTISGTVGGSPSTNTITVTGHISGGIASGTFREDTVFTLTGTPYKCSSGDQTWSATRTG